MYADYVNNDSFFVQLNPGFASRVVGGTHPSPFVLREVRIASDDDQLLAPLGKYGVVGYTWI